MIRASSVKQRGFILKRQTQLLNYKFEGDYTYEGNLINLIGH